MPVFVFNKSFEGMDPFLVFQVSTIYEDTLPKRGKWFFFVEGRKGRDGVTLLETKPENLKPSGAFVNLLRKHAPSGALGPILQDLTTQDTWVKITTGKDKKTFWIRIENSNPPEISLVTADATALVRKSGRGTFTKSQRIAVALPTEDAKSRFRDISQSVLTSALRPATASDARSLASDVETDQDLGMVQRRARDKVARRLKTVKKALQKLENDTASENDLLDLEKRAALLKTYLYLVKEGDFALRLEPVQSGLSEHIEIELDPERTPGGNLKDYFVKIKKAKKSLTVGSARALDIKKQIAAMTEDLALLRSGPLPETKIASILTKHKLGLENTPRSVHKPMERTPFRTFQLTASYKALVGKGPSENDELTKSAKSNDFWIHTASVPGSHVIIIRKNKAESPPPEVLRKAAILAIHFSKLRGDLAGEVYVTERSNIRKTKGLPPGLWIVDQAETLFVRYDDQELKAILDSSIG